MRISRLCFLLLLGACCAPQGFPWPLRGGAIASGLRHVEVTALGPVQSRATGRVLIRRIARATRANLDFAAYVANPVLHEADAEPLVPTRAPAIDRAKLFGGAIEGASIVGSLDETPLTATERRRPLAFSPLVDYLAEQRVPGAAALEDVRAAVRDERWGLPGRVGVAFQEIAVVYLHRRSDGVTEAWGKIELQPWLRLFPELPDDDGDGYAAIYARVKLGALSSTALERLEQDYVGRTLASDEVRAWADKLASYWYPSRNTDLVDLQGNAQWPRRDSEAEVVAALRGFAVRDASIVIRGKPYGAAIYNVFVIPGMPAAGSRAAASRPTGAATASTARWKQTPVSVELEPLRRLLRDELQQHGGSYAAWAATVRPLHAQLHRALARRAKRLQALIGRDGFLFYRRSLEYLLAEDLEAQQGGKNPLPAIVAFKDYLAARNIDFLLVPVPAKVEVFPDKLPGSRERRAQRVPINPGARRLFGALAAAGVEVIDLLPAFLAARAAEGAREEPLYQPQDTHWSDRGLRLAARLVAERVRRYPWYAELERRPDRFTTKRVSFQRLGDLCSRLAPAEQRRFRPATLSAQQVFVDGAPYEDDPASPIALLGDSFTGVYQRTDCEHAGVSAHIAQTLGLPVDLLMSWGGGPSVRRALLSRGDAAVRSKRLVIWLFAARDLHDYWEGWEVIKDRASPAVR